MRYTVLQSFSTTFQRFREGDEIDESEIVGSVHALTKTQLAMLLPIEPPKVERQRAPAAREGEMKTRPAKADEHE